MPKDANLAEDLVPITGRRLVLPEGPIFHLQRRGEGDYELGAFRAWAGYKTFGTEEATGGQVLLQHVLSFGASEVSGRTGVHCHLAHAHIVIPTSGRGVFSYDGVVTEAVPGAVIVQHGGTVHDQFEYSFSGEPDDAVRRTPLSVEPVPVPDRSQSFGFLELFVPPTMANVEIIPPEAVTEADQRTAWDHPYHTAGAYYALQSADAPDAAYRPLAGHPQLEARDAGTWAPSGGLVATWIIRPASSPASGPALSLEIPGETGGVVIFFALSGSARLPRPGGEDVILNAGDALTCSPGLVGDPIDVSPDLRLIRFFIAAKAQQLRERTPAEIEQLEALGPAIITRRVVRTKDDAWPINGLAGKA